MTVIFCKDLMNTKNIYLEWHFSSLIHFKNDCYSAVAHYFKDLFYSMFLFCNFQLEIFSWWLGKKDTIFLIGNMTQYRQ